MFLYWFLPFEAVEFQRHIRRRSLNLTKSLPSQSLSGFCADFPETRGALIDSGTRKQQTICWQGVCFPCLLATSAFPDWPRPS